MRDFAKQPPKSTPPKADLGDKLHSRKKMLMLLLAILVVAFILSFVFQTHHKHASHDHVTAPQQTQTIVETQEHESDDNTNTTVEDKDDLPATQLAPSDEEAIKQDLAENNESIDIDEPQEPQVRPLNFTFYDTLTHNQVQVDARPQPIVQYRITYMLQVGSYRSETDANAVRARLLLAGLNAQVEQVGNWYRVVIRNIESRRDGDAIRHRVERAGISGSLLRETSRERIETPVEDNNSTENSSASA